MSRFRTPLKNVRGLGTAKTGTAHFVNQRLTATALVFLTLWFVYFVISLVGSDYLAATDAVSKPWNAVLLVGFLVATFWHGQLGMQVVLEDYVHNSLVALALQVSVKFIAVLGAIVSIFAVARIALAG